mgnify:CR=1 FL=1
MHWQVSDDSGADVTSDARIHDRFFSAGPEAQYFFEPGNLFFQFRYQFEFDARDRPQGRNLVFSFVKVLDRGRGRCCRRR